MHDETVDRTTNGSGPLSQMSYSELSKLDAAAKHRLRSEDNLTMSQLSSTVSLVFVVCLGTVCDSCSAITIRERFAGERIPTLEEAVEECIKLQLSIYFDVKGHPDEVHTHVHTYTLL